MFHFARSLPPYTLVACMVLYLLSFVISPMKIGKRSLRTADVSPRIAAEGRFVRRPSPAMSEEKHLPFADDGNVAWNLAPHWGKRKRNGVK